MRAYRSFNQGLGLVTQPRAVVPGFVLGLLCLLAVPFTLSAQVVEQNPSKLVFGQAQADLGGGALDEETNDEPLGVDLQRLTIVDEDKTQRYTGSFEAGDWLNLDRASKLLHSPGFVLRLARFEGQPISSKLISEIRKEVTLFYRAAGFPLVAVSVPEQEITSGHLRLEVLLFKLEERRTEGNLWTPSEHILARIRSLEGEPVDANALLDDINWLNLNPFRNLRAVFEPGEKVGTSKLTLRSEEQRPWKAYVGASSSGQESTGRGRIFTGFNLANLPLLDHQISYRFTRSTADLKPSTLLTLDGVKGYLAHSGSYFAPIDWGQGLRTKLTVQANYIRSNAELADPITQSNWVQALYTEVAVPTGRFGIFVNEVFGAFDRKSQKNEVRFAGVLTRSTRLGISNFIAGIRSRYRTQFGKFSTRGELEVRGTFSPGNVGGDNNDAAFAAASSDPAASSKYTHVQGTLRQVTSLFNGLSLKSSFTGQYSKDRLPGLEQFSAGGLGSVRGYQTNEASGEYGYSSQTELHFSAELLSPSQNLDFTLSPFLFLDQAWVRSRGTSETTRLASLGAGLDFSISNRLEGKVSLAYPLRDTISTKKSDIRIDGQISISF